MQLGEWNTTIEWEIREIEGWGGEIERVCFDLSWIYIYIYKDAYIIVVSSAAVHCKAPGDKEKGKTSIEKLVP